MAEANSFAGLASQILLCGASPDAARRTRPILKGTLPVGADRSLPADLPGLIATMYDTMDAAHGVGLAANQIGYGVRVFVYDCADDRGLTARRRGVVINPVLETSEIPETMPSPDNDDEGCLSVPGESFPTGRAEWARVTGLDADGSPVDIEGTGLFARMLQ